VGLLAAGGLVALLLVQARRGRLLPSASRRPNVLLVTLDTTRADHTSAYGYDRPTTPRLEELARDGVQFDAAYAPIPNTLPSHVSMMTGLLPSSHGTTQNGIPLAKGVPTLAEVLARAGYRTAAFLGSFAVSAVFGLNRGFSSYDEDFTDGRCPWKNSRWNGYDTKGKFCRRGDLTRKRVVRWLAANGYLGRAGRPHAGRRPPFFVWVHFFDPHSPYAPLRKQAALFPPRGSPPTRLDRLIAKYDAEIHFADQEMGKLLDRLRAAGQLRNTLVIVVGDHGEGLMQHGWMMHGLQIYEEAVRVPFVLRWPARLPRGRRIKAPVEIVDLTPTVLALLGLPAPGRFDGINLADAATGAASLDPLRAVRLQRRTYQGKGEARIEIRGEKYGVRVGDWKYIEAPDEHTYELYDLALDPGETRNLAAVKPDERIALSAVLDRWVGRSVAKSTRPQIDPENARKLEALGYVE
jgi:arylsulfatase A-like enzyme